MKTAGEDRMRRGYEDREKGGDDQVPAEVEALPEGVATAQGVRCQNAACRGRRSRVTRSYTRKNQSEILRVRVCENCGLTFKTVETVVTGEGRKFTEDSRGRMVKRYEEKR